MRVDAIFAVYVFICGLLLALRHKKDAHEYAVRLIIVTALPLVGWLMPLFWPRRWQERNNRMKSSETLNELQWIHTIKTDSKFVHQVLEIEKEMNVVPLEETLLVNDLATRRKAMIDLLKLDSLEYLDVLQLAVGNEDSETSHYAVSAIMEVKRKLTLALQELSVKYEENKDDPYLLQSYAEVLNSYMRSGFLDDRTLLKHKYTYIQVLDRLLQVAPDSVSAYGEKTNVHLELLEYDLAEQTAKQFLGNYPLSEEPYLLLMKVYFTLRSYEQLKETIHQLQNTPIRLSKDAFTYVRFWSERGDA